MNLTRMETHSVHEYHIGVICALPKELKAVRAVLDEEHTPLKSKDAQDHNSYVLGRIGQHDVVAAGLPAGVYGTTSAANVAKDMLRTFPQLRFGLLVGIAGGIPDVQAKRDIRLGDVVVGQSDAIHSGVVQHDLGKRLGDGQFARKGALNKPPQTLLTALTNLQADLRDDLTVEVLEEVDKKHPHLKEKGYRYQGADQDQLHCVRCDPSRWWWILWVLVTFLWPLWRCQSCSEGKLIRPQRAYTAPVIHYGTIASGNLLLKNATERDRLARDLGALCVEMEAAGLDDYPCLVIRGICDYSDAHKNDAWQEYAALTAAAFAKALLGYVSPQEVTAEAPIRQILSQFDDHFQRQDGHYTKVEEHHERQEIRYRDDRYRDCHRAFATSDYERRKNINADAVPGTCRWVLDHPQYRGWLESTRSDLLWISADPGCGKSVLSKSLVDNWLKPPTADEPHMICYFFFKDNEEQSRLSTALCAILHQMFSHQPDLIRHALPAFDTNKEAGLTQKIDELWRIIQLVANDTNARPTICVLDALDECSDADRPILIDLLCTSYQDSRLSSMPQGCLKWMVTGRPHDDLQGYFGQIPPDLPSIRLRGEDENEQIRNEIDLVIDRRMSEMGRKLKLTDNKMEEFTRQLRAMENRTYLWLHLVLEDIERTLRRSARPNQVMIPSLPQTVDQAYEKILERITHVEEKQYATAVFTIILGARRPLTIGEMALAFDIVTLPEKPRCLADLAVDASNLGDKIRGWCGLFIFIKHDQLYLIHQTARDFLLSKDEQHINNLDSWKHCLRHRDVEMRMAETCVSFLCLSDFDAPPQDAIQLEGENVVDHSTGSDTETFFEFASEHWADYVRPYEAALDGEVQCQIRVLYDSNSERFWRWVDSRKRIYRYSDDLRNGMDNVHWASFNGHYHALQHILGSSPNSINKPDSIMGTPLSIAALAKHEEIVKLLLAQPGIDVNSGEALSQAVYYGHKRIVELLLAQPDIDVDLESLLSDAAHKGHKDITELLLAQSDIHVDLEEPIIWAVRKGHKEIVELLLTQPNNDVNLEEIHFFACLAGNRKIADLLLAQPGINVNRASGAFILEEHF